MEVQYKPIIFTKEEMKLIKYHLPTIESIIVNHSYSNLSVAFRQDMKKLGDKIGLNFCTTCSSGIFSLVSRIYKKYNEQLINERKQENGRKKGNSGAQG
jgi:hypothetical protein